MNIKKSPVIEALEILGPSDVETLAGHLDYKESMVNAMLTALLRRETVIRDGDKYRLADDEVPAPAEVNPEPAKLSGISHLTQKVVVKEPVIEISRPGPTDRCRAVLSSINTEIAANDLAERANVPLKNISGLLSHDVKSGKITARKVDGRNFYQVPTPEVTPTMGFPPENTLIEDYSRPPQSADKETQTLVLPTVSSLNQRIKELQAELQQKVELRKVLIKLEQLKNVGGVNNESIYQA